MSHRQTLTLPASSASCILTLLSASRASASCTRETLAATSEKATSLPWSSTGPTLVTYQSWPPSGLSATDS